MRNISPSNPAALLGTRAGGGDWGEAITLWLATRRSVATRRSYACALEDFLASCPAHPRDITRTDVLRWVQQMGERGLSAATIAQRLAGVSSFYTFVSRDFDAPSGRPLHDRNPAAGKSLRPTVEMYGKAAWLGADEARALLRTVHGPTLRARRNYALFLGYILLARRNSEWRTVRWGDFERRGEQISLRWQGKGRKDQRLEVPLPVWNAVCAYLRAAGRLNSMDSGDYIFTAIRTGQALPKGGTLDANRPLSAHEVGRILKGYLRSAGIEPAKITPHSLRHTGAMLRRAAGASDQEIMDYLGHGNLATTQVYLHALEGQKDAHWMRVSDFLGLSFDR